jgi:hypothetical protein
MPSLLGPNFPLSILSSNIFSLCSSLNVRDRAGHSYKTTVKIKILFILILHFFEQMQDWYKNYINKVPLIFWVLYMRTIFVGRPY